MPGKRSLSGCYITLPKKHEKWTHGQISGWISNRHGHFHNNLTEQTTHLVIKEKMWRDKLEIVQKALEANRTSNRDIKIVSYEWLEDSLSHKTKPNERAYLAAKLWPEPKNGEKGCKEPKSHVGMMAEVFQASTDKFVDVKTLKATEKQQHLEDKVQKEEQDEERRERLNGQDARMMQAKVFKKGAKKARNEIFSQNHHIYMDSTGFKYDIFLTKVDTKQNRNERFAITLQIYESNSEPHTYATNCQFSGTKTLPSNNVLAAIGCTFYTAFLTFKKVFKEKTGAEWNERIHDAEKGGPGPGSEKGKQKDVPVDVNGLGTGPQQMEDFETAWFQYRPPMKYGPTGLLPAGEMERLAENAKDDNAHVVTSGHGGAFAGKGKGKEKEPVDMFMSGANGGGPVDSSASSLANGSQNSYHSISLKGPSAAARAPELQDLHHSSIVENDSDFNRATTGGAAQSNFGTFNDDPGTFDITDKTFEDVINWPFDTEAEAALNDQIGGDSGKQTEIAAKQVSSSGDEFNFIIGESFDQTPEEVVYDCFSDNHLNKCIQGPFIEDSQNVHGTQIAMQQTTLYTHNLQNSFHDSFTTGSQNIGETQIATRALGEFKEFLAIPPDADVGNDELGGDENGQNAVGGEIVMGLSGPAGLNLGASCLGKRKRASEETADDDGRPSGAAATLEQISTVPDLFVDDPQAYELGSPTHDAEHTISDGSIKDDQTFVLASPNHNAEVGEGLGNGKADIPRSILEEQNVAADEQLQTEQLQAEQLQADSDMAGDGAVEV